ncbi:hypothetical protein QF032_005297 [Streptomyces achromogenes]|uniref:Uncharacterized protein n=1 Tax=Streptomyces achromogenes TaxID=67255 RepID=A0ABU0Q943_STRAH|nr:hypothetical protein [Streptomyces achromogenes]MDQ0686323.1 hypothetical protein [Streptomyces achromogenes]MDQ0833453.1 hypothetical protein [Streptomyces achromogenes]
MPSIQHAPRPVRLLLGNGPELHLSMYREFVTGDDERGRALREPGTANERSGP